MNVMFIFNSPSFLPPFLIMPSLRGYYMIIMKTKEEIEGRIAKLKIDKAIIEENGWVLTEAEAMDLECIMDEIAILRWVLN